MAQSGSGLRIVSKFLPIARKKREVLPGLEPGLQGSEPWVLTNYTIEPLGCVSQVPYKVLLVSLKLGWCSWLSRVPHTHEVTSSILVPSILFFFVQDITGVRVV